MSKPPKYIRLHYFEGREYYDFVLDHARKNVRSALDWKRNYSHLKESGYADYLKWAKVDADRARAWAGRLKIHFGKESVAQVQARKAAFAAYLEQRRAA